MFNFFAFVLLIAFSECAFFETFFIESNVNRQRNAIKLKQFKWPNAIVPYEFGNNYTEGNRARVLAAMEIFREKSCVKFILKQPEHIEHIRFVKANGCGSYVGYRRGQKEPLDVFFADACLEIPGAIQHELLHVLGMLHEQARPDRDDHIDILWENIDPRFRNNFGKAGNDIVDTFGLPYDFDSLMHYPNDAFAKYGKNITIVAKKDPSRQLGQSKGPTFSDMEKIRRMYNCYDKK